VPVSYFVNRLELTRKTGNIDILEELACLDLSPPDSLHDLRVIEPYLFLDRRRSDTENWWLYDTEGSQFTDDILRNARGAQDAVVRRTLRI
jgi:hypothetical protein